MTSYVLLSRQLLLSALFSFSFVVYAGAAGVLPPSSAGPHGPSDTTALVFSDGAGAHDTDDVDDIQNEAGMRTAIQMEFIPIENVVFIHALFLLKFIIDNSSMAGGGPFRVPQTFVRLRFSSGLSFQQLSRGGRSFPVNRRTTTPKSSSATPERRKPARKPSTPSK